MYKRDTKVMYRGQQWYYIGQDHDGDHLLSKGRGYTGTNDCTNNWFKIHDWTFEGKDDTITLVEPTTSPLENAIVEYKHEHGVVGTRPFKVLLEADKYHPQGYPSTWLRFNGSTLEYEHTNGWSKAQASELCLILFNTTKFLYLKGDEPTNEWTPKIGDKVRILPRKNGQKDVAPYYMDAMQIYVGSEQEIKYITSTGWIVLDGNTFTWNKDWLEHVE